MKRRNLLEKLGIAFLVVVSVGAICAVGLIIKGALEARAASKEADVQFRSFTDAICQYDWRRAYSMLDAGYRSQNDINAFQAEVLPGYGIGSSRLTRCEGTLWRSVREQDGTWKMVFNQYLSGANDYSVNDEVTLHSGSNGWTVSFSNDPKR
jgi:hypothetical protein